MLLYRNIAQTSAVHPDSLLSLCYDHFSGDWPHGCTAGKNLPFSHCIRATKTHTTLQTSKTFWALLSLTCNCAPTPWRKVVCGTITHTSLHRAGCAEHGHLWTVALHLLFGLNSSVGQPSTPCPTGWNMPRTAMFEPQLYASSLQRKRLTNFFQMPIYEFLYIDEHTEAFPQLT